MKAIGARFRTITDADWRESLIAARKRRATASVRIRLKAGEPCGHAGCADSRAEPCPGCGRRAAGTYHISRTSTEPES